MKSPGSNLDRVEKKTDTEAFEITDAYMFLRVASTLASPE